MNRKRVNEFNVSGTALDTTFIWRNRSAIQDELYWEARQKGYVPYIDKRPECTVEYIPEKEVFEYEIVVYVVYVGKRRAQEVDRVEEGDIVG